MKGLNSLTPMEVPSSIQRIEPFPASALALLRIVPPQPSDAPQLRVLLEQEPKLLEAIGIVEGTGSEKSIEIAITLLLRGYMQRAFRVYEDRRYWDYTLACAVACSEIAARGQESRLTAYVGGLLHDIGRLALIASYPDKYANLLLLTDRMFKENPWFDILEYERVLFGLNHFETGAWLADTWGLPAWLRALTGKFNDDAYPEHRELVATIRCGTRLAHSLGFGYLRAAPRAPLREILCQVSGAWEHWKTLDQWESGEEYMRGRILAQLALFGITSQEDE
jgi:hypothetical protein